MRILYIQPDSVGVFNDLMQDLVDSVKSPDAVIDVINLDYEPKVANIPQKPVYQKALFDCLIKAEQDGYDAAIIGCFADPGMREGQNLVSMPVYGAMQLGMHLATLLGKRISLIGPAGKQGVRRRGVWWHQENIFSYGFRPDIVSFRKVALDRPSDGMVQQMVKQGKLKEIETLVRKAHEDSISGEALTQARLALDEDNADVIVLACTCWGGLGPELERKLGAKVVDPVYATVLMCEAAVRARSL